jgi:hypothetical protein
MYHYRRWYLSDSWLRKSIRWDLKDQKIGFWHTESPLLPRPFHQSDFFGNLLLDAKLYFAFIPPICPFLSSIGFNFLRPQLRRHLVRQIGWG